MKPLRNRTHLSVVTYTLSTLWRKRRLASAASLFLMCKNLCRNPRSHLPHESSLSILHTCAKDLPECTGRYGKVRLLLHRVCLLLVD